MNAPPDQEWADFEQQILGLAAIFSQLRGVPFDYTPPKTIASNLKTLDDALTIALQAIGSLQLEYEEGQDIGVVPFNWPVVSALCAARGIMDVHSGTLGQDSVTYPTELIKGLRELRDVARFAHQLEKPSRGNSSRRIPSSARMADLAKNFVFKFRSRFGYMPPITKSKNSRELELLRKMFEKAGEVSDDAAEQLRLAIEKDAGRELLPSARTAKATKRIK